MSCCCGNIECKFQENKAVPRQKLIATINKILNVSDIVHILMSGVRILNLDLSFGTYSDHVCTNQKIDQAIEKYHENIEFNIPITKICTIRGKSNIVGRMRNDCAWSLKNGELITLTCDERYETCSTNEVCYISNFENIIQFLAICDLIRIGTFIELHVIKIVGCYVTCCIYKSGILKSFEKLICPHIKYSQHVLVNQEIRDCNFAINNKFDFIIVPNVQKPEYYHAIKRITKRTDVKLIGRTEEALDNDVIERIYEHFYGLYVDSKKIDLDFLMSLASKLKKPILSKFHNEGSRYAIQICEMCDCLELKMTCLSTLIKAQRKLKRITADIDKYAEYNTKSGIKDDIKYAYNNSDDATLEAEKFLNKPVICITKSGETIKNFKNRYIIALTKDDKIAKRLQLQKNVVSMVYFDCDDKSCKEQVTEMTRIGMKYLLDHNIIVNEKSAVVQYDDDQIN